MSVAGDQILIDSQWTDVTTTLNHTGAGANSGPENTLTDRRGEFYRTANNVNVAFVNYDLGQVRAITSVAVFDAFAPLTVEHEVRVFAADSEAELGTGTRDTIADVVVPPTVDGFRHLIAWSATPFNRRFLRVVVADPAGGSATQQLGFSKVRVGGEFRPSPGALVGSNLVTPGSESEVTETEAGSQFIRHLFTRRTASVSLDLDFAQANGRLWDLLAFSGSNRPVVYAQDISLDITDQAQQVLSQKQLIYGRFPNPSGYRAESGGRAAITLDIEEWT